MSETLPEELKTAIGDAPNLPKPVDSETTKLEKTAVKDFFIFLLQEVASYISYSQKVPMFFGFFMMLMFIVIGIQANNYQSLLHFILRPFTDAGGNAHYDGNDLMWLYGKVTLGLYVAGSLVSFVLKLIYKKQLELNFKSKMKIVLIIASIGYIVAGILAVVSHSTSVYSILIVFYIATIIASAYGFMFDSIIDFFMKALRPASTNQSSEEWRS